MQDLKTTIRVVRVLRGGRAPDAAHPPRVATEAVSARPALVLAAKARGMPLARVSAGWTRGLRARRANPKSLRAFVGA